MNSMKRDKDLEWLKNKVKDSAVESMVYDERIVSESEVLKWIDHIDNTGCNWTPSGQKQEPIAWGDVPIQEIRDSLGSEPSGQRLKPSNDLDNANPKAILHSNITAELNAIYIAKNSDYGDAFGETYKKLGIISAVTRITDKVNRLQSLATKSESERLVKDESIRDTLSDLANYAILSLIEMDSNISQ